LAPKLQLKEIEGNKMKIKFVTVGLVFFALNAFADKCVIDVTREACPGKDKESYEKCKGEKQCTKEVTATSEKDCAKKALKECENARLEITKLKIIKASFDGKPVEAGKNFCAADRPDFNKCK